MAFEIRYYNANNKNDIQFFIEILCFFGTSCILFWEYDSGKALVGNSYFYVQAVVNLVVFDYWSV